MTESPHLLDQLADWHEDAFSWAVACCRGDAEAGADALQEAYVKVATERARFGGKSSLKTWWLSVVRFTALERGRGRERRRRLAEAWHEWWTAAGEETPEPEEMACDPERLRAALARLPARQAEVLHLVFQQALSLSEAAAVMGVSLGSARQHYDRAKKRLRALLAAEASTVVCAHEA